MLLGARSLCQYLIHSANRGHVLGLTHLHDSGRSHCAAELFSERLQVLPGVSDTVT